MKSVVKSYVIGIIIPLLVGGLSAILTSGSMGIYNMIITPPLAPPSIVFPIVWTILFILMGISSVMVYNTDYIPLPQRKSAIYTYALSLFFNFFWSVLFFNFRTYGLAFFWLVGLWILILLMIVRFYRLDKPAGLLQIPYLLWVTFAGYLNYTVWILNK